MLQTALYVTCLCLDDKSTCLQILLSCNVASPVLLNHNGGLFSAQQLHLTHGNSSSSNALQHQCHLLHSQVSQSSQEATYVLLDHCGAWIQLVWSQLFHVSQLSSTEEDLCQAHLILVSVFDVGVQNLRANCSGFRVGLGVPVCEINQCVVSSPSIWAAWPRKCIVWSWFTFQKSLQKSSE